jgi:hypothetical protein
MGKNGEVFRTTPIFNSYPCWVKKISSSNQNNFLELYSTQKTMRNKKFRTTPIVTLGKL